jgi:RHS repeat-associated protein
MKADHGVRRCVRAGGSVLGLVVSVCVGLIAAPATAQNFSYYQGLEPRGNEALVSDGPEMLGHRVNLYTGALEFVHTDVDLPGNSKLKVAFTRSNKGWGGGWRVDSPRMAGKFASSTGWVNFSGTTSRCSSYSSPPAIGFVNPFEYWQGTHIYLPGEGPQEVLRRGVNNGSAPSDGYSYPLVTRDHWQIRCLPTVQNGTGEGFVARSPSGEEYRFDWMAKGSGRAVKNQSTTVISLEHNLMATQVTDRFGNWVRYAYDPANPTRLTSITANDGRAITITYLNGNVGTVSDGTRVWTYNHDTTGVLNSVVLPDGSRWEFNLAGLRHTNPFELGEGAYCDGPGTYPGDTYTGAIKHPSGLLGTYTLAFIRHNRSNVARWCIGAPVGGGGGGPLSSPTPTSQGLVSPTTSDLGVPGSSVTSAITAATIGARWPRTLVNHGLIGLTVSGPGVPTSSWSYGHGAGPASWANCNPCHDTKTATVLEPSGLLRVYTFGVRFQSNEGQLLSIDEIDNGTTVRRTQHRYRAPTGMAYPEPPGTSIQQASDFLSLRHRPIDQTVVTQQGVTFTWEAAAGSTGFDHRARPVIATRSSSLGFTKTETTAYHDNTAKWMLGQLASVTDSSGAVQESSTCDAATALRLTKSAFGLQLESYNYYTDGTLRTRFDAGGRGTVFSNYRRGIAQNVANPDSTAESAVVNNIGRLSSHTNAVGTTTAFGYDAMGRLVNTTHPNEAGLAYHPTTQSFQLVNSPEYGIAAGHWRQTVSTGNAVTIRYFDAMWRERLKLAYDAANAAGTSSFVETRYDADGRKTFVSYPSRTFGTIDSAIAGTAWSYDGLGRQSSQVQSSEQGALTATTEYLPSFQKRVTNARGFATTFAFQAFDAPSEDAIAAVWAPEGSTLGIVRDAFGKPLSITRSGGGLAATRSYVYDGFARLCKSIEPESGANVQAYDAANNVAWRASGLSLPSTSSCDYGGVSASRQIAYGYDTRNRLTSTSYGDGSPGIGRSYYPDSLPYQVWSAGSTWTYGYNNRRLRTVERLNFGGADYNLTWGLEAHGNVASLTYPDGGVLSYWPDALGRPTQASGFASGVWYHPNSLIGGYTLANGIAHSSTQNTRGLPAQWRDAGVVQDAYGYDANANVTAITDQQEGISSRSMGYDGLDRLSAANGIWGAGSFGYDALDNLRSSTVGGRSAVATIDGANRLSALTVNGAVQGFGYDANGNLTARGGQGFDFDIGNRLRAAFGRASYAYDGHGRRTWLAYDDGSRKLQVYSQAGKLLWTGHSAQGNTKHIYLGDRLIAEANNLTGVSYSHTDALGSPVARTNASTQVTSRTRYEPYGATAAGTNPTGIGFTGHVNDADTGLVYMQQRYYEPLAGRFLSVDPVTTDFKTGDHFDRYTYASNNPYKFIDPDGRSEIIPEDMGGRSPIGQRMLDGSPVRMSIAQSRANLQEARAAQLKTNAENGKSGEAATRQQLGDKVAGEQVTFKTSDGTRTRTDFVTKEKGVVETKTGDSQLSTGQQKLKNDIDAGRSVTPVGKNAENAGLKAGEPTKMSCCTIDRQSAK